METIKITSAQNPVIKKFNTFNRRKSPNSIMIEGVHLHQEYLKQKEKNFESILVSRHFLASTEFPQFSHLENIIEIPDDLMAKISPSKNPAGILSLVAEPKVAQTKTPRLVIILERIQDPGNMGTMLRTSLAMNVDEVLLLEACTDIWSEKCLRAGMGAQFYLPCRKLTDLGQWQKEFNGPLLATDLQGTNLWQTPLPSPAAFIFGNEGQGVSHDSLKLASQRIKIPMNPQAESLNVASSLAILSHEWNRQHYSN